MRHCTTDLIREAITEYWGERCATPDPDCPCCHAWRQLYDLENFFDEIVGMTINHDSVRLNENVTAAVVFPSKLSVALDKVDKEWCRGE